MQKTNLLCTATLVFLLIGSNFTNGQKPIKSAPAVPNPFVVIADPDVRISYDGNLAHMEAYIAASVTNPDFLFACGELIVPGRDLQATEARLYYSADAGARWSAVLLPNEISGGWDNAVVAGIDGMLYFLTSNLQNGLTLYRSQDNGKTWNLMVLTHTTDWDRPHIVVDNTTGQYRGRLYIAGESEKGISIISSSDGGQTFTSPVIACAAPEGWNMATTASPMVLSDGRLVLTCTPYPNFPARAHWKEAAVGLVFSKDGGQQFTPYHPILTIHRQLPQDYYPARVRGDVLLSGNFMLGPSFAVAPPGSPFADRLYAAWQDTDSTGCAQLFFAWSANHGATWSIPQPVDRSPSLNNNASPVRQGAPMLAVNREGVIGVAWYDGRHAMDNKGYDIYFTASADGGQSFFPAVRVSSATSHPARQGANTLPAFSVSKSSAKGERMINTASPFSTRSTGADYATMTVDAAGRFHPLWTDARDGAAWQLYTSTVRVIPEKMFQTFAAKQTGQANEKDLKNCILDDRIQLLFGEPRWNSMGNEVLVPVRLLNTSSGIITEPISVQVAGAMLSSNRAKTYAAGVTLPVFFDPVHESFSDSATIVYPVSPRAPLFPNGVTAVVNWRLRITAPEWIDFRLHATVTGGGCLAGKATN